MQFEKILPSAETNGESDVEKIGSNFEGAARQILSSFNNDPEITEALLQLSNRLWKLGNVDPESQAPQLSQKQVLGKLSSLEDSI